MKQSQGKSDEYVVYGRVTYSESGQPAVGVCVTAMDADLLFDDKLGDAKTDDNGEFSITYGVEKFRDLFERAPDIYLVLHDDKGSPLVSTRNALIRNAGKIQEIHAQIPGSGSKGTDPLMVVGTVRVNRLAFERLEADVALQIAETAIKGCKVDPQNSRVLKELSPNLELERLKAEFSLTPLIRFLEEAILIKKWPREVSLRFEELLFGYDPEASYATYDTTNFSVSYQTSGSDQPPAGDAGGNILMPGTGAVVGTITGGNGVPDYVEKIGFWLENALATYTNPPFNLLSPATGGRIPIVVTGSGMNGHASKSTMSMDITIGCNDDLIAAISTHELMHLIQYQYEGAGVTGGWNNAMREGGAVLGEDVVFDTHNRYIVMASQLGGVLKSPGTSLNNQGYRFSLFLKYLSEQQSSRIHPADEPTIGVETYRELLERFNAEGYTDVAFETAVGQLPWYQSFYRFGYLDAAKLDETSSETLLGNFWLACYLKDFGAAVPDRRFDFMEDEENATWDSTFQGTDTVSALGSVALSSTTTLNSAGSLTLSSGAGAVSAFAARFYKVNIASAVDTLRIDFTAAAGFSSPLIQVVLVEPGNVVRDILRSDRTTWSRTIANARGGINLDHVLIVVCGTTTGGSFTLSAQAVSAKPDVMVTRWHHVAGTHYEIDSFGWTWTWASPDVWVDNNGNGLADSEVYFNQNNKLFIRLRNQGHGDATGISVQLWYQDASGGLSDDAWQSVKNTSGVTQTLMGLNLAAGATNQWSVDWSPTPSGESHHFCVRAVVSVPGDPNTDNKRCLSNFGNVIASSPYRIDLHLLRRKFVHPRDIRTEVIPRAHGRWVISATDINRAEATELKIGEEIMDTFRVRRRVISNVKEERITMASNYVEKRPPLARMNGTRRERWPDPFGHYPTDPRALPPGVAEADLITIAHIVDGKPIGGFTWAIRSKK